MNQLAINNSIYNKNIYDNKYKNTENSNKHTKAKSNISINNDTDNSNISDDAVTGYKFLTRLEDSIHSDSKDSSINKYISEYKKIKKEIASGTYGSNTDKYKNLLDNAFKKVVTNITDSVIKQSGKDSKIKLSSSQLIECQREHDTATSLTWIFKAEHKRILKEIEYYKKKKDNKKVFSLRQLSESYKHVINNLSGAAEYINSKINDSFSSDEADFNEKLSQLKME